MAQPTPMFRTGAEHYAEASRLLHAHREQSARISVEGSLTADDHHTLAEVLTSAQVHATLAVADGLLEVTAQMRKAL